MRLSDLFTGVAAKELSDVEVDSEKSNQHEINGTKALKEVLGQQRRSFEAEYIYVDDDMVLTDVGEVTWYDSRENHKTRTEHRLYYKNNLVVDRSEPGDVLFVCLTKGERLMMIVSPSNSETCSKLMWLFGFSATGIAKGFQGATDKDLNAETLGFVIQAIFNDSRILDFKIADEDQAVLKAVLDRFGNSFPTTRSFSAFAREFFQVREIASDPDRALVTWLDGEEEAFRALERHILKKRLEIGFIDVDDFLSFSLSVQNRRKSRAGYALENHLEFLFQHLHIPYSRNMVTENRSRPDFLFPGIEKYHDVDFSPEKLFMLGVKTSCKERWRQVLAEAQRIPHKHLLTLEPRVSSFQIEEMRANDLQLVVPKRVHLTFAEKDQSWLLSLADFLSVVDQAL